MYKILFAILTIFLVSCTPEKDESTKTNEYWEKRNQEGHEFSKKLWNKCFKDWSGQIYIFERNDGKFLKESGKYPSTQICGLSLTCDYVYKKNCVIQKICNHYVASSHVEQKFLEQKYEPVKCTKGIK